MMKEMDGLCLSSLKQMSDDYIEAEISNIVHELNLKIRDALPLIIIPHRSYNRIYLRWKIVDGSNRRISNYSGFGLQLDETESSLAIKTQTQLDYINSQLGLFAKRTRR